MSGFWDNLISFKGRFSGPQLAGWKPRGHAVQGLGCRIMPDQKIPVGEGVTLSADVFLPRKPGRYPAIIVFGGYAIETHAAGIPTGSNEVGSPPIFTDRGYVHVVIARRGMGRSQGEAGIFFNDQDVNDHETAIAWAAEQNWCDGRVGLFGTSYYGITAVQVAARRPPALKAFFVNEMCTDFYRHIIRFGGVPALYFLGVWAGANFIPLQFKLRMPAIVRAALSWILNSRLHPYWEAVLMKRADGLFRRFMKNTPVRSVREWWVNLIIDGNTRATNIIPPTAKLEHINVPFVVVQNMGYFNLHQFGSYELFEKAGTEKKMKWMILSPPNYELPCYAWQDEALAFFDSTLRDFDNGYLEQAKVRYWQNGSNTFVSASDFPDPKRKKLRLFLVPRTDGAHGLSLQPPHEPGLTSSWIAIPMNSPILGGVDEVANQTLIYEFNVEEEVSFAGPITANFMFSSNEIDSQIVVKLSRVSADSQCHILSMGTISAARRMIDPNRGSKCEIAIDTDVIEPLVPGKPVRIRFSLTPAPTVLSVGEKLRLEVGSRTDLLKGKISEGFIHFDLPTPPYFARNQLHYGPESYLEI